MAKFTQVLFKAFVMILCLVQITLALECIFCKSHDLYSNCRLGHRAYKPKLTKCHGPDAKCYATAQVHENNTATFRRGCSTYADFCNRLEDLEYCETCGSKYCNYWHMEVSQAVKEYLDQAEPEYKPTPKPVIAKKRPTPSRTESASVESE